MPSNEDHEKVKNQSENQVSAYETTKGILVTEHAGQNSNLHSEIIDQYTIIYEIFEYQNRNDEARNVLEKEIMNEFTEKSISTLHLNNPNHAQNKEIENALQQVPEVLLSHLSNKISKNRIELLKAKKQKMIENILKLEQYPEKKKQFQRYAKIWLQEFKLMLSSWVFFYCHLLT